MVRTFEGNLTSDSRMYVENIEYLTEIPSVWPVPRVPTAYVVDLSAEKFRIYEGGKLLPVDILIGQQVITGQQLMAREFRRGTPGSMPEISRISHHWVFSPLHPPRCEPRWFISGPRDSRQSPTRYELEVKSRNAVFAAQRETRRKEGDTPEQRATVIVPDFFDGVKSTLCSAKPCGSKPKLMKSAQVTRTSSMGKPSPSAPSYIANALANLPTICKVLLFHPKHVPHNHPIPPPLKLSHETKAKYRKCVGSSGLVGATIANADNVASTSLILDGHRPGQYDPALQNKRIKQDIIREEKKKVYPAGMGITGKNLLNIYSGVKSLIIYASAYQLYKEDRYVHRFQHTPDGGIIIFTCFTALLALLDDEGLKGSRMIPPSNESKILIYLNNADLIKLVIEVDAGVLQAPFNECSTSIKYREYSCQAIREWRIFIFVN
ncbi:hypothetical protein B0H10DRAFT_1962514 [Mycena sp. CBHHK59/15]|nr:hypothetical protein B0H10DRAFT_1962514 [Mycena sp. CBHHK59/15]